MNYIRYMLRSLNKPIRLLPFSQWNKQSVLFTLFHPPRSKNLKTLSTWQLLAIITCGVLMGVSSMFPLYFWCIAEKVNIYCYSFLQIYVCWVCVKWFLFLPNIWNISDNFKHIKKKELSKNISTTLAIRLCYISSYFCIPLLLFGMGRFYLLVYRDYLFFSIILLIFLLGCLKLKQIIILHKNTSEYQML